MNTCETCRYWVEDTKWSSKLYRRCKKFGPCGEGPEGENGAHIAFEDCWADLLTGPKFGCVHHAGKPEDGFFIKGDTVVVHADGRAEIKPPGKPEAKLDVAYATVEKKYGDTLTELAK